MLKPEIIHAKKHRWRWIQDPKGFFHIRINSKKGELQARWSTYKERKVVKKIVVGKRPDRIYHAIIDKGLISRLEHAAYLGKELQRAFDCLKSGRRYVQVEPWRP